jgi:RNA polymerase-binding protein DksA
MRRIKALDLFKKGVSAMATAKKNKAVPAKSLLKTVKKAVTKKAAKASPKTRVAAAQPSPKKPSRAPVQSVQKTVAAAKPKPALKTAPKNNPIKKAAPPLKVPSKNLSKKTVKTAVAPKAVPKPAPKMAGKPVTAEDSKKLRLSKAELNQFKSDLLAMRDRITGQSGSMRNDALQRTDEINPEEDGTDAFMRLQTLEQVSSQQQIIANIDESLRAIEKGTYGVCDMCGVLISKQRLTVLPFAKNCIQCQSEMERVKRPGGRR